jgi:hypothetical protein
MRTKGSKNKIRGAWTVNELPRSLSIREKDGKFMAVYQSEWIGAKTIVVKQNRRKNELLQSLVKWLNSNKKWKHEVHAGFLAGELPKA